ncbi:MAG: ketosteroid isomerase-like protein [Saprospiraceae bacterium]|jgi:ketosteroid isomerase-like protein
MNKTIQTFYQAFADHDAEKMVSFYSDDIEFTDPAFGTLQGERAKNMWRMLIASQRGKTFDVVFTDVKENESSGSAHWEAKYKFSQTGRQVHNKIDASFVIKDGKIIKHIDRFSTRRWASQAMGLKGWLLGGTSFFQKKLNAQTNKLLDKWEAK